MYRIVIDENISFAREAFGSLGEVIQMAGRQISRNVLIDADALIVRSVTNVDRELLEGTKVRFVGTATIGTDHLDTGYLSSLGIAYTSAKGCNADAVAEYVVSALLYASQKKHMELMGRRLAVIGCGNIGSRVARLGRALGMEVIVNDPPLEFSAKRSGGERPGEDFAELQEALSADIITLHVPMILSGKYRTHHLINDGNIGLIKNNALLVNASRGPVVDNSALLNSLKMHEEMTAVLDVWEGEPEVNAELLKSAVAATPHIAGYSLEGKINGTVMIYEALCRHLNIPPVWRPQLPVVENKVHKADESLKGEELLESIVSEVYDIKADTFRMKQLLSLPESERKHYFDHLRKHYPLRREFFNYTVHLSEKQRPMASVLKALRFNVES